MKNTLKEEKKSIWQIFGKGVEFSVTPKNKFEKLPIETGEYEVIHIEISSGPRYEIKCMKFTNYNSDDIEDSVKVFQANKEFEELYELGYIIIEEKYEQE